MYKVSILVISRGVIYTASGSDITNLYRGHVVNRYKCMEFTNWSLFSVERIYWACEVASKKRKMLMSRPKVKPVSQIDIV